MHRRHAGVRRRLGRHGGARWSCRLWPRAVAPGRRRLVQSRGDSGPASKQHRDVHADLCRAETRHADRLFRHQCPLDRHRRHHAALHRYLHGRPAAALDQAVVEGRADRGSLSHHRKQHALASRTAWATSPRSSPAAFSAAISRRLWPTNTASRRFSARSKPCSTRAKRRRARSSAPCPTANTATKPFFDNDGETDDAAADPRQSDRRRRRNDHRLFRASPSR